MQRITLLAVVLALMVGLAMFATPSMASVDDGSPQVATLTDTQKLEASADAGRVEVSAMTEQTAGAICGNCHDEDGMKTSAKIAAKADHRLAESEATYVVAGSQPVSSNGTMEKPFSFAQDRGGSPPMVFAVVTTIFPGYPQSA